MSKLRAITVLALAGVVAGGVELKSAAQISPPAAPDIGVGSQYGTTHVYVEFADFDRFVASFVATFGGKTTKASIVTVTPAPSLAKSQLVLTPVGNLSVFGFTTPVPTPSATSGPALWSPISTPLSRRRALREQTSSLPHSRTRLAAMQSSSGPAA
jgi:hypothetical protein